MKAWIIERRLSIIHDEGRRLIMIKTTIHYLYSAVDMALKRLTRNIRTYKKEKKDKI